MKNLLNLEGVKALSRMEQKSVFGGETGFAVPGCVTLGNGCNGNSTNPNNLCCPELKCEVTGANTGICK